MSAGELDGPGVQTIHNHAFEPDGDWWETCAICGLAEAAHETTTLSPNAIATKSVRHAMREAGDQ